MSQGVVQTLSKYKTANLLESTPTSSGQTITQQIIAVGPWHHRKLSSYWERTAAVFSIPMLPSVTKSNAIDKLLLVLAILLIPAALCYTFGKWSAIHARVGRYYPR